MKSEIKKILNKILKKSAFFSKNSKEKISMLLLCGVCIIVLLVVVKFIQIILSLNLHDKFFTYLNGRFNHKKFSNSYIEGMKTNTKRENVKVVCLGDSIFANKDYVPINESLEEQLNSMLVSKKSSGIVLAQDNAEINSVYSQLNTLDNMDNWGSNDNFIFLSIGGNNILNDIVPDSNIHDEHMADSLPQYKKKNVDKIFKEYILLVKKIRQRFPTTKLILSTIYFPYDYQYRKYHNVIKYWNKRVINYAEKKSNNIDGVLRIHKMVKNENDFTHQIEPSAVGGKKIVEGIKNIIF